MHLPRWGPDPSQPTTRSLCACCVPLLAETGVCGWILKPESAPPVTRTRVSKNTGSHDALSPTHLPATGFCTCRTAADRSTCTCAGPQPLRSGESRRRWVSWGQDVHPDEPGCSLRPPWLRAMGLASQSIFSRAWGPPEGPACTPDLLPPGTQELALQGAPTQEPQSRWYENRRAPCLCSVESRATWLPPRPHSQRPHQSQAALPSFYPG